MSRRTRLLSFSFSYSHRATLSIVVHSEKRMGGRRLAIGRDAPSRAPEMGIVALTTLIAAWTLREMHAPETLALVGLGAGALAADALGAWAPAPFARPGVDGSATLGLLSLPWTLAARATDGMTSRDAFAFWTCVTAGAVALARDATPKRIFSDGSRALVAVAVAMACSAAASTRLTETSHASLASHASLSSCVLAHALAAVALASRLPSWFPGILSRAEATLVAHGAVLAAGAAAAAAAASTLDDAPRVAWLPGHFHERLEDSRLVILFHALLACALFAGAAAPPPEDPQARRSRGGSSKPIRQNRAFLSSRKIRCDARDITSAVLVCVAAFWFARVSMHARPDDDDASAAASANAFRAERFFGIFTEKRTATVRTAALWIASFSAMLCAVRRIAGRARSPENAVPTIVLRKVHHVLAVVMFAPPTCASFLRSNGIEFISRELLGVAYAVALAAFAALEVARTRGASVPLPSALGGRLRIGAGLDRFFQAFLDHRDAGGTVVIVSHVSLLVAAAAPLWLSDGVPRNRALHAFGPFAGLIAVGIGDTVASVVGVRFGKTRAFRNSRKTVEGASAGAVANVVASWIFWRLSVGSAAPLGATLAASVGASWLEAATEQSDNAFVPLTYFAILGCLLDGA